MVRQLKAYIDDCRLVQSSPLYHLNNTRIGVDGFLYLRKLLSQPITQEPLNLAIGSLPLTLSLAISRDITLMQKANLTPFFVFHGITPQRSERPFTHDDARPLKRSAAWDALEKGKMDAAQASWMASGYPPYPMWEYLPAVLEILDQHGVEYMRAPYSAWGQLAYLERHPEQLIHAVYSGVEYLMFTDVDRVILSLDFDKNSFSWISKKMLLQDLALSEDQFLDACCLAGFEYIPTFPPLNELARQAPNPTTPPQGFNFKLAHDCIRQFRTGFNAVSFHAEHLEVVRQGYVEQFCKTRTAIAFHLIMADDGHVKPFRSARIYSKNANGAAAPASTAQDIAEQRQTIPSDLHDVFGYRLPDEVYRYVCTGMISANGTLSTLLTGHHVEPPPLCNGETKEYRQLIRQLTNIRTRGLKLVADELNPFFKERNCAMIAWFEPDTDYALLHTADKDGGSVWTISEKIYAQEVEKNGGKMDWGVCTALLSDAKAASATALFTGTTGRVPYRSKKAILADMLMQTLEQRDYVQPSSHQLTAYGKALYAATKSLPSTVSTDLPVVAIELLRHRLLHPNSYSHSYLGNVAGSAEEKRHMLLICRVATLVPALNHHARAWIGPVSRELLVTASMARAIQRAWRHLSESILLRGFLKGNYAIDREHYHDVGLGLPFPMESSTAVGILVKTYLEHILNAPKSHGGSVGSIMGPDGNVKSDIIEGVCKSLSETFPGFDDIKVELKRAFAVWDALLQGVRVLGKESAVDGDVTDAFEAANMWLQFRRLR